MRSRKSPQNEASITRRAVSLATPSPCDVAALGLPFSALKCPLWAAEKVSAAHRPQETPVLVQTWAGKQKDELGQLLVDFLKKKFSYFSFHESSSAQFLPVILSPLSSRSLPWDTCGAKCCASTLEEVLQMSLMVLAGGPKSWQALHFLTPFLSVKAV